MCVFGTVRKNERYVCVMYVCVRACVVCDKKTRVGVVVAAFAGIAPTGSIKYENSSSDLSSSGQIRMSPLSRDAF